MAQHTIYDSAPITGLTSTSDNPIAIRIGTLFYTAGGTTVGWRCRGARIYIPAGSVLPATVTLSIWVQPTIDAATLGTTPLQSVTIDTAIGRDGWFEAVWDSIEVTPGQKFLVSYEAANRYQYIPGSDTGVGEGNVQANDGSSLYLSEAAPGERGFYYAADGSSSGEFKFITGLDVIVDDDSTAPTAPTDLTASADGQIVNVSWTASTDNVDVIGYRLYRSEVAGFTADSSTQIAQTGVTTNSYDVLFATGTYYYKLTAVDQAGNVSPVSNEVSINVTVDGTGVYVFPSDLGWAPGAVSNDSVAVGQTLGTAFALSKASPILGARFYSPVATNNISLRLWDQDAATELLSKTGLTATAGWSVFLFDSVYTGVVGTNYIVTMTIGNSTQSYTARTGSFSITRTEVGTIYSETDFNGLYDNADEGMPTQSFNSSWYGIDVIVAAPPARTGNVKVWDGVDWTGYPLKVWDGADWQIHPTKGYDDGEFIVGK